MDTQDQLDYAVPYDEDILLCYSHSDGSSDFVKHKTYGWFMIRVNTIKTYEEIVVTERQNFYSHGLAMWIGWTVLGYIMIASRRYLKVYYHLSHSLHVICGTCITFITIIFALQALINLDWRIGRVKAHTFFGFLSLVCVLLIALGGSIANFVA